MAVPAPLGTSGMEYTEASLASDSISSTLCGYTEALASLVPGASSPPVGRTKRLPNISSSVFRESFGKFSHIGTVLVTFRPPPSRLAALHSIAVKDSTEAGRRLHEQGWPSLWQGLTKL